MGESNRTAKVLRFVSGLQEIFNSEEFKRIYPNLHSTFRSSSNRQTSNNSDNDTHGFRQLFNVDGNERVPSTPDEELAWHLQRQEYEQDVLDNRRNHRQHHNQFNISDYDTNESLEAAFESLPNNMSDDNNLAQRLQREEMGLQNYVRQMPHAVRVFPFYPFFNQDRNANGDDDDNDEIDVQQQFMHALMRGALHMPHGAYGRRRFHGGNRDVRHLQQYQGDFGAEDYETLLELDEITGANKQKLNDEQIKKISTVKFTKLNDLTTEGNTCSICFENFEENQSLHDYPCTHKFHKICSTRWLAENNVCPVCRVPPVIVEQTAPQHRSNVHRSYRPPRTVNNHNRDNGTDRASHNQRHGGGGRRPRFN
ncbi:unnamed protein product [Didymodactylos carnosus]|uniref:RING-type domain-containing protein n=1 Tax=Didymodactylos carnosus TaxID=1234261 RepID=A0A813XGQ1_9BILA|nr:unnamed protein product [Didymodactylos carnosus]CAF0864575.1 unnamed protein product [Didymodactylos carnosus]CAF3640695.1 unnamed protein product [Didymodactylos carnosus]CAF3652102.1 unnamed protein product [Didymodactylos carnosus]